MRKGKGGKKDRRGNSFEKFGWGGRGGREGKKKKEEKKRRESRSARWSGDAMENVEEVRRRWRGRQDESGQLSTIDWRSRLRSTSPRLLFRSLTARRERRVTMTPRKSKRPMIPRRSSITRPDTKIVAWRFVFPAGRRGGGNQRLHLGSSSFAIPPWPAFAADHPPTRSSFVSDTSFSILSN